MSSRSWETEGGEGQLDDWGFLPVLGAVLSAGLAGDSLRLAHGNRTMTLFSATSRGVPATLTDRDIQHQVFFADLDLALAAARAWLDRSDGEDAYEQPLSPATN
jgi:hypothetical protein